MKSSECALTSQAPWSRHSQVLTKVEVAFDRPRQFLECLPNLQSLSATTREHVLNVVRNASQVVEGIVVVKPASKLPLLVVKRMPQLPFEVLPAVRGVSNVGICSPQGIHLSFCETIGDVTKCCKICRNSSNEE